MSDATAVFDATKPNAVVVPFAVSVCVNVPGVERAVPLTLVEPISRGVMVPAEMAPIVKVIS